MYFNQARLTHSVASWAVGRPEVDFVELRAIAERVSSRSRHVITKMALIGYVPNSRAKIIKSRPACRGGVRMDGEDSNAYESWLL